MTWLSASVGRVILPVITMNETVDDISTDEIRTAYENTETIADAARELKVSHHRLYRRLVDAGYHEPAPQTAASLAELEADDVSALSGREQ